MEQDEHVLVSMEDRLFFAYPLLILCLGWLGFAIYMFQVNPGFFGFSGGMAFLILMMLRKNYFYATNRRLLVKKSHVLGFYTKTDSYSYEKIEGVNYYSRDLKAGEAIGSLILPGGSMSNKAPKILVKLKDGKRISYLAPFFEDQLNLQLIETIKASIPDSENTQS